MITAVFYIAVGIVLKVLVPMDFIDQPVRDAWLKVIGYFKPKGTDAS